MSWRKPHSLSAQQGIRGVWQTEVGPRHARYARVEPDLPRKWRACHPNIVVSDGTSCVRAWVSSTSDGSRLSSCAGRRACARASLAHRPAKDSTGVTLATPSPRVVGRAARLPAARVGPPPPACNPAADHSTCDRASPGGWVSGQGRALRTGALYLPAVASPGSSTGLVLGAGRLGGGLPGIP